MAVLLAGAEEIQPRADQPGQLGDLDRLVQLGIPLLLHNGPQGVEQGGAPDLCAFEKAG